MDKRLSSNRNMFQVVLNILLIFSGIWTGIASVAAIITSFKNKVVEIDDTAAEQQASIKQFKINKRKKKREMADKALSVRGKISAFAAASGDTILLGQMKISFSKLFYLKDTTCIGNAEIIYDAASAMKPEDRTAYNITDVELTGLRDAIDTFKNIPSPQQMKAIRKQLTELLPELFREGNEMLVNSLDGLMYQFKDSDPDFYTQYFNARRVFESHRHTTLEGSAIDQLTGEDLQDVQVIITSDINNFEETTDVQGEYKQQISPEITYTVKFVLPDYEEQEFENVKLIAGQHQRLDVKLRKK